jgi:hypothetical protein
MTIIRALLTALLLLTPIQYALADTETYAYSIDQPRLRIDAYVNKLSVIDLIPPNIQDRTIRYVEINLHFMGKESATQIAVLISAIGIDCTRPGTFMTLTTMAPFLGMKPMTIYKFEPGTDGAKVLAYACGLPINHTIKMDDAAGLIKYAEDHNKRVFNQLSQNQE